MPKYEQLTLFDGYGEAGTVDDYSAPMYGLVCKDCHMPYMGHTENELHWCLKSIPTQTQTIYPEPPPSAPEYETAFLVYLDNYGEYHATPSLEPFSVRRYATSRDIQRACRETLEALETTRVVTHNPDKMDEAARIAQAIFGK